MTEPQQKPNRSKQDYGTPPELVRAVERRFGKIAFDLAADEHNSISPLYFDEHDNSLDRDWNSAILSDTVAWLNPPFGKASAWVEKASSWASENRDSGARILILLPASIGSNWFSKHVWMKCRAHALTGRITFSGCTTPFPKDCMILEYGAAEPGFELWDWRK